MTHTTQHIAAKEKKVPQLRFKEFEGEWEKTTLGKVSVKVSYGIGAAATKFDGENKYLRITDIDENSREFKPNPLTSPDGEIDVKYKLIKGDLVFARTGASVGKSYLYKEEDGNLIYAGFLIKFHIKNALPEFVYLTTFKESYNRWVYVYSMRSGQPGLNAEDYKGLKLNLPSLSEQQKIAAFLSAVDRKIRQLTRKKELLKQYKKGVMQRLFPRKPGEVPELRFKRDDALVPAGASGGSDFPDWEEKRLGEYLTERVEYPVEDLPLYSLTIESGIVPKSERYERSFLVKNQDKAYKVIRENDFAFNPMNLRFGALARLKKVNKVSVSRYYNIFYCKENADYKFMEMFLTSYPMIQYYERMATGSLVEKKRVHYLDFIEFKLMFPSLREQQKIASFLSGIDEKIGKVDRQVKKMKEFKRGLLQQMFV